MTVAEPPFRTVNAVDIYRSPIGGFTAAFGTYTFQAQRAVDIARYLKQLLAEPIEVIELACMGPVVRRVYACLRCSGKRTFRGESYQEIWPRRVWPYTPENFELLLCLWTDHKLEIKSVPVPEFMRLTRAFDRALRLQVERISEDALEDEYLRRLEEQGGGQ